MLGNWNIEWLNLNSQRRYPVTEESDVTDQSGSFVLPDDFIVALGLPIHAGMDVDAARFFIRNIGAYATGFSVVIAYQAADNSIVNVATALIARQTHTRNQSYALGGIAPFDDTVGKIVIGRFDSIDLQPPGFITFDPTHTRLEPDVIRPIITGVSKLVLVNGDQRSAPIYGDVELVAGSNVQLIPVLISGQDPRIIINAISGEGLIDQCLCEGDNPLAPPIQKVNGITPTMAGDFTIIGTDCLQVQPIENGLQLVDVCSKPCCGCEELEAITQDLERFGTEVKATETFIGRLETSVNTMDMIVLGAKLSDKGCQTC
jgi:hypothetical protein